MGGSCVRWTGDTELAFLLALKLTGQVVRAAAAIGRGPGVRYARRDRRPDFAAAWDATLAEMEAARLAEAGAAGAWTRAGAGTRPLTRTRADGWTQQRQRAFTRALADTGRWGEAAQRVGISMTSVQRLRKRSPAFDAACERAMEEVAPSALEVARTRAVDGWEEPVFHGGRQIGTRRVHSDALLKLVIAEEQTTNAPPTERYPTPEQTDASIMRKLAALKKASDREARAAELAWCERMEKAGLAP